MNTKTEKTVKNYTFKLSEIGYSDLEGNKIKLHFDHKQFGNTLYQLAPTIQVDDAARHIFNTGEVTTDGETLNMIVNVIDQAPYLRRVKEAIRGYVDNLIKEDK